MARKKLPKHTGNTNNSGIRSHKVYNKYHCTQTVKVLDIQNCPQTISKMLKQPNFFTVILLHSKGRTCKVLPFYGFWFIFMISFVAPTGFFDFLGIFSHLHWEP